MTMKTSSYVGLNALTKYMLHVIKKTQNIFIVINSLLKIQ